MEQSSKTDRVNSSQSTGQPQTDSSSLKPIFKLKTNYLTFLQCPIKYVLTFFCNIGEEN